MITTPRRLGALALIAVIGLSACSSSGASTSPAASVAAPTTATSAAPPTGDASTAPSFSRRSGPAVGLDHSAGRRRHLPGPALHSWFQTFNGVYANVKIDYQANGSGGGIKAITEGTVDFGASDAAMKDNEIAALPSGAKMLHIPTALGAVVMIYNLPDTPKLQLDSANIAGIYLGTIKKWNDPAIAANNAGVTLPDLDILVVHRRTAPDDQRIHDLPRHRRPDLAIDRRQGQGGQVADRHRRGRQ